jgi:transcriptional regulator with XRE-family HTH domain
MSEPSAGTTEIDDEDAADRRRLGSALAELRGRAGMSQEEAAAAAGYNSKQAWQRFESGAAKAIFRPALQRKLVGALGRPLDEWIGLIAAPDEGATREPLTFTAPAGPAP